MAATNSEIIGRALTLLVKGVKPYIKTEMYTAGEIFEDSNDPYALLKLMKLNWISVFGKKLSDLQRSAVFTILEYRNKISHGEQVSYDDMDRALDNMVVLLSAIGAKDEADKISEFIWKKRTEKLDKRASKVVERLAPKLIEGDESGLKGWRHAVEPQDDVVNDRFHASEFAADLYEVHSERGSIEYTEADLFFKRTFVTKSLREILIDSIKRMTVKGGTPVYQLQTTFGGGKTHSMLALYHLYGGKSPKDMLGIPEVMEEAGVQKLPKVNRAVIVGNRTIPVASPQKKSDGTVVHTLWGEIAWQLGGKAGYALVKNADETGTNPGDSLREVIAKYSPCLVLIDEWVAYARQLVDLEKIPPAGSFDTQMTFAQTLTEAITAVPNSMLVVSLPESNIEIGGEGGQKALASLKKLSQRIDQPWRPAAQEESYEIIRRRIFSEITDDNTRRAVARAFVDMYSKNKSDFGTEVSERDYMRRIEACYPFHPEFLDRLYNDWASLENFQRTRGLLRLTARIIKTLWDSNDQSLLIMPGCLPVTNPQVKSELCRYIHDAWDSIIDSDIDGENSIAHRIEAEDKRLARTHAAKRVARTLFLRSAPTASSANKGLEAKGIWLGCAQPGESVSDFNDALRKLSEKATHIAMDGTRYWFDTQQNVNKLAMDRAESVGDDDIMRHIADRLQRVKAGSHSLIRKAHICPTSTSDIPDEMEVRLVVLHPDYAHSRGDEESEAEKQAKEILEFRGTAPRHYQNTLVFVAADRKRLEELKDSVRKFLAWKSIDDQKDELNLDAFQRKQVKKMLDDEEKSVKAKVTEAYQWLLTPRKKEALGEVEWERMQVRTGSDNILERAEGKLRQNDDIVCEYGGSILRMNLDKYIWRESNHVKISDLKEYHAKYLYLPRLRSPEVLDGAVQGGLSSLNWIEEGFGFAEGYDDAKNRYFGIRRGGSAEKLGIAGGFLVKPEVIEKQLSEEGLKPEEKEPKDEAEKKRKEEEELKRKAAPKRFHASKELDTTRLSRDAHEIAESILQHLSKLDGAKVTVTIEIEANVPDGVPDDVQRTVSENCNTLKFGSQSFETE